MHSTGRVFFGLLSSAVMARSVDIVNLLIVIMSYGIMFGLGRDRHRLKRSIGVWVSFARTDPWVVK